MSLSFRRFQTDSPSASKDFEWFAAQYIFALEEENAHHPLLSWRRFDPEKKEDLRNALKDLLSHSESSCLLLMEKENCLVGYFLGLIKSCLGEVPDRIAYLNGLYVLPEKRAQGLGQKLYEEGLKWFKGQGLNAIELYLAEGNEPALRFWQKQGYGVAEKILLKRI